MTGMITDRSATTIIAQMLYLDAEDPAAPMTLRIDSPGGVATSTLAIYDAIQHVKAPVCTAVAGVAGGTAILIAVAGASGHRTATARSLYRFVRFRFRYRSEAAGRECDRLVDAFAAAIGRHTQLDRRAVARAMDREERMHALVALRRGFVDHVGGGDLLDGGR
ncbi:MAG: ATP-dependent Clp protease proteolytic subunit [Deltaproteobacteria bacterium]|nr:ATP-dependent Clp protease proteolytic subunit [Deltaproteobacteria bacterium]